MIHRADSLATLPLDALQQIDRICERFEAQWSSGSAPSLAESLAEAPAAGRAVLLLELVSLDREYRGRRGAAPSFEAYAAQLPKDVELLREVWPEVEKADAGPDRIGERPSSDWGSGLGGARTFGDYELLRELGRGGMGIVYEARQVSLNRLVALKMIRDSEFASVDDRLRFHNEARVVATLDHPNIVPILEVGEFDGQHGFSMKLIAGGSLSRRLDAYAADPGAAAALVIAAAEAVHHAHQRGILHRDLKPANILVDEQGRPHVTDFGLAKRIGDDSELTRTGSVLGTPSYMAPEQALGKGGSTTTATDVYGLGTILYALLAGRAPFVGDTPLQTLDQLRGRAPDPPSRHNPRVPRDLEVICLKCLEKDPAWRYASARALADDLRHWQAGEPIAARPVGVPTRAWMWCRRKPVLAGLMAGLVAASAAGFAGVATQWRRAEAGLALAESANADLKRANLSVEKARDSLRQDLYLAEMVLGQQLIDSELGIDRVEDLLARWHPSGTEPDRRGWEWYHLHGLRRRNLLTVEVPDHRPIGAVTWSPDGRYLAVGLDDGRVMVWDPDTGREIVALGGQSPGWPAASWSPDGRRLAAADRGGTIRAWNAGSWGEAAARHVPPFGPLSIMSWSPDGHRLASGGNDRAIGLWDGRTGDRIATLDGKAESLGWSPDGGRLATGFRDGTIALWDAATKEKIATLRGHAGRVGAVAWSPGGRRLASGGNDQTIQLWDAAAARRTATLRGHSDELTAVAWSPDGRRLASTGRDRTVKLWDADRGEGLTTLRGHTSELYTVAWSPDGRRLASAGYDGRVQIWDVTPRRDELPGHADAVYALGWSPDDRRLASAGLDHTIRLWDVEGRREIAALRGHTNWVEAVSFSPDGRRLASGSHDGTIRLWDAATGREITALDARHGPVLAVSWSPDGHRLASATWNDAVGIWDLDTGKETAALGGHKGLVWTVRWSPDGRRLASGAGDGTVRLWDAATGVAIAVLRGHTSEVKSVGWSPDGGRLASAGTDGIIRLWDVATGATIAVLRGHTHWVLSVSWSPDGRRLASASWDSTIKVWDPDAGRETATLRGHTDRVNAVAWSADGRCLASGGWDKTVRLWDARPGYASERSR